jgi:hypothetical protein
MGLARLPRLIGSGAIVRSNCWGTLAEVLASTTFWVDRQSPANLWDWSQGSRGFVTTHAAASGAECTGGPDGCCVECGVALVPCDSCGSRGYHGPGCSECDS